VLKGVSVCEQLMTRRRTLLEGMQTRSICGQDVAEHERFIQALEADLAGQHAEILRRHRIINARLKTASGSRVAPLEARMDALLRWQRTFNESLRLLEKERAWFHKQPIFLETRAHVLKNFKKAPSGLYYNVAAVEEMEERVFPKSFEDLLKEEKKRLDPLKKHQKRKKKGLTTHSMVYTNITPATMLRRIPLLMI